MVACWWCCHEIDGEELHMPCRYDPKRKHFYTYGKYCSWSCIKAHALERFGASRGSVVCGNIIVMRKQMYGVVESVQRAPDRYKLQMFGGDMSIDEFRNQASSRDTGTARTVNTDAVRSVAIDPVATCAPTQSLTTSTNAVDSVKKMEEIRTTEKQNAPLKLKRTKPLLRSHNDLESALGLVITPTQLSQ